MRTTIPRITPRAMLIGSGCWGAAGSTEPTLGGTGKGLLDCTGSYVRTGTVRISCRQYNTHTQFNITLKMHCVEIHTKCIWNSRKK